MGKIKILPLLMILFALVGCSLAQPEQSDNQNMKDRFVGYYAVFGDRNRDYSLWEDYGSASIDTEFGALDLSEQVLFANYDAETGQWIFPGLEGFCAFATEVDDRLTGQSGLKNVSISYSDSVCNRLEGTIYIEKSEKDFFVTMYEVFETEDGRIYTNGDGNSTSGPATGGGALSSRRENNYTENGKVVETYEFEIKVNLEPVVPTEDLTLVQYDENDVELCRDMIPLEEQHITPKENTAWMVVIEKDKEGNSHRTAYEPPANREDWVAHDFYLSQPDGTIQMQSLIFEY